MTPEEIKALIEATIKETLKGTLDAHSKALLDDVSKYVDERSEALEAFVTTPKPLATPEGTPDPDSPLAKRLALLEAELATEKEAKTQQDKANKLLSFKSAISDELGKVPDLQHGSVVHELLYNRLVDGYELKDEQVITKSGKTLNEEVTSFLGTPEGLHFVKPQQVVGTVGVKPSKPVARAESAKTLAQALLA
jgi:hypothetical protein